jgi:hypothetical protein
MTWTPTTVTILDGNSASKTIAAYTDGSNIAFANSVLDALGAIVSPATAGNQATANASLATIATNAAVSATAAKQDTGNTTLASIAASLAAIAGYLAPVPGVIPMPALDTVYTTGRYFAVNCSGAGNVSVTYSDGTTDTFPVAAGVLTVLRAAITKVNSSGTTATATYENWK